MFADRLDERVSAVIVVFLRSLWLWHEKKKESNVFRLIQGWMELLSHAVKGGANKMSVTARANRMLSLSPFIKNSCYLKSLYPQHFFILSFEDLFFCIPSHDHCSFSSTHTLAPSRLHLSVRVTVCQCTVPVLRWMKMLRMLRWMFCFSFVAFQMCY